MRSILAASLLLSPMLYAASAVAAIQPKVDAPADAQVSHTGVTTPATLDSANISISSSGLYGTVYDGAKVVLALKVDANGNASDVRVLQPVNPQLDARVVAAVRQASFHPAKLDNHAIPVEMNLVVSVRR
jgi:TonB family protein